MWRALLSPLSLAAYVVLGLIAYSQLVLREMLSAVWIGCALSLGLFLTVFIVREFGERAGRKGPLLMWSSLLLQIAAALANLALISDGMNAILLVLIAAQLPVLMRLPAALLLMLALDVVFYLLLSEIHAARAPLFQVAVFASFQAFALLMGHYAHRAESANVELAAVNAHLLATRSLLAEGVRDGERLRLSRELHDVAGHTLTALKLHLELAQRLPEAEQRQARIASALALAEGLLDDIRGVVGQLRRHDGIDLPAALATLAAGYPGVEIGLEIDLDLRVADVERAETLLRVVQEGLTNAIRHGAARRVRIRLQQVDGTITTTVEDQGRGAEHIRDGNGLSGMRERVAEFGGSVVVESARGRGTRLSVRLPNLGAGPA